MGTLALSANELAFAADSPVESLPVRRPVISELDDIDELVRVHQARIHRFAVFSTGDPDLADSITQDTFLRAYRGRENFRGDCSVTTWLTGIAINVMRDHLRSPRFKFWKQVQSTGVDAHEMASFLPSGSTTPERTLLAREKVKELWQVLETLSIKQRTIFMMKFSEEMSIEEIGDVLQMKSTTVRTHLHRALKAVRSRLGATV
jgi:RNA polymerase sigma-70 factor (ECF subfamily)